MFSLNSFNHEVGQKLGQLIKNELKELLSKYYIGEPHTVKIYSIIDNWPEYNDNGNRMEFGGDFYYKIDCRDRNNNKLYYTDNNPWGAYHQGEANLHCPSQLLFSCDFEIDRDSDTYQLLLDLNELIGTHSVEVTFD